MIIWIYLAVTAFAAIVTALYLKDAAKSLEGLKPLSKAPTPKTTSIFGAFKDLTSPDVHRRLTRWANELGGLYVLKLMGTSVVVLSDLDLCRPLITRGETELPKYKAAYSPSNQLGTKQKVPGLFSCTHETAYHAAVRKAVAPAFSQSNLTKRFPKMRAAAVRLAEALAANAPASPDGTTLAELDVTPYVTAAVFDLVAEIGFDVQYNSLDDPVNNIFLKSLKGGLREISARVTDPFRETLQSWFWFLPSSRKVAEDFLCVYGVYRDIIRQLKERGEPRPSDQSIGACLLRVRHPDTDKLLTIAELQANISAFLVGGFDTSVAAVLWALYDIARHPHVAQGLEKELKEAGLITADGRPGRLPEWSDLTSLSYFNMVMKESMRLHVVAGCTATFRVTEKPMQIGEYWAPKDTPIWIPAHTMANAAHNFPSPDKFLPERWATTPPVDVNSGPATAAGAPASPHDWTSLVFSSGTRGCPGTNQGLAQVRTVLLVLLSQLKISLGPTLADHRAVEEAQIMALVVTSGKGTPLIIQRR